MEAGPRHESKKFDVPHDLFAKLIVEPLGNLPFGMLQAKKSAITKPFGENCNGSCVIVPLPPSNKVNQAQTEPLVKGKVKGLQRVVHNFLCFL